MGKTKEGKKEKKVVEEVEMEVEEKKSKKDKKRKVVEAEVEEKEDKKDKKKKSKKVESEEEEEEEETPKKKSKKDKKAKVEEAVEEEEEKETPKKDKKSKKDKKKKVEESDEEEEEAPKKKSKKEEESEEEEEDTLVIKTKDTKMAAQVAACETTKVFMSNLSFQVDEDSLKAAIESKTGKIVSCKWMEDKETGKFRGSGIIEFDSTEAAGKAVLLNEVEEVLGRAIRVRLWEEKAGGNDKKPQREMSARPDNCTTIFCGNLDYNIDDDKMVAFFKDLAEVKQVRWLTDKVSGEFRGCGFVEFYDAESVDKVIVKNGSDLCGRSIRIDYSAPKPRREY